MSSIPPRRPSRSRGGAGPPASPPTPPPTAPPESAIPAGHDLRCRSCGYGVAAVVAPPICPMCGGDGWDFAAGRPFRP
jgi:hypothetical protein